MTKTFVVEPDHDVLVGRVWYGPGLLAAVEPDERVEIYVTVNGKRGACIGAYGYGALNVEAPPHGLRCANGPRGISPRQPSPQTDTAADFNERQSPDSASRLREQLRREEDIAAKRDCLDVVEAAVDAVQPPSKPKIHTASKRTGAGRKRG